jgi:hypothetical protein
MSRCSEKEEYRRVCLNKELVILKAELATTRRLINQYTQGVIQHADSRSNALESVKMRISVARTDEESILKCIADTKLKLKVDYVDWAELG